MFLSPEDCLHILGRAGSNLEKKKLGDANQSRIAIPSTHSSF